ncbi:MAG: ArsR family transcriptional regulator [Comamonadaceae bacterium]|nr:MAG: ArsR family transcriptional regulator [Comamonadaceae bacterium]
MLVWNAAQVAELLKSVAQETRLNIVRLLFLHATDSMSAGVIAVELEVPPNLLSFHLKELVSVGVICKTVSGRNVFYSLPFKIRRLIQIFSEEFGVALRDEGIDVSEFGGLPAR